MDITKKHNTEIYKDNQHKNNKKNKTEIYKDEQNENHQNLCYVFW
jgi:hypothetical protein